MTLFTELSKTFFTYDLLFFSLMQLKKNHNLESCLLSNFHQTTISKNWLKRTAILLNKGCYNYPDLNVHDSLLISDLFFISESSKKVKLKALVIQNAFILFFRLVFLNKFISVNKSSYFGNFEFFK